MRHALTKRNIVQYIYILSGSLMLSLGLVLFLIPNKVVTGGAAGLAIVLHYITRIPTGLLMILVNIPLLAVGIRNLGKTFALRSVLTIVLVSVFTDLFKEVFHFKALSSHLMLSTLYGGILVGAGLGFVFKGDSSAGGGTILAKVIAERTEYKVGQVLFVFDICVILAAGITFQTTELALWGFISIYVSSKVVDTVLTGKPYAKVVHIVSEKVDELKIQIVDVLGRSGTIISGTGLMEGESKQMIFLVVDSNRLSHLRELIRLTDPEAFMIVMEASEMLGRGKN